MLGWIVTTIMVGSYTIYAIRTRKIRTMSRQFWLWRNNDPVQMWLVWLVVTWHFMFRDREE